MMKVINKSLFTLTLLFSAPIFAGPKLVDKNEVTFLNVLKNGYMENGTAQWTSSGGSLSVVTAGSNLLEGDRTLAWDSNAGSQTLSGGAISIPKQLSPNSNAALSCRVNCDTANSCTHKMQIFDGSNVINEVTIADGLVDLNFIVPSSGSVTPRFLSVASNEPNLYIDECKVGDARGINLGSISQATIYGTATQPGATNCSFTENTSAGESTYVTLAKNNSCASAWTVTGAVSVEAATSSVIILNNRPPGNYEITLDGAFSNSGAQQCNFRFNDGTNSFGATTMGSTASSITGASLLGQVQYTTSGTVTIAVQASDDGGGTCGISNTITGRNLIWIVKRFPLTSEQVYRPSTLNWRVDANIFGANPGMSGSVSTYTGIESASLTIAANSGSLPVQIGCSGTNPPTGSTCSVGNESVSVSFDAPRAGAVLACASFGYSGSVNTGQVRPTFQIVETATNSQTIIQEGKSRIGGEVNLSGSAVVGFPVRVCGNFNFASAGTKMLRLMFEQVASGGATGSVLLADRDANNGARDIHWEVYPIDQSLPMPLLIGSVTSLSSGVELLQRAFVSSAGVVSSESGDWINGNCSLSTNVFTCTLNSGVFSAAPVCTATPIVPDVTNGGLAVFTTQPTTSSLIIETNRHDATQIAYDFNLMCVGPK